MPWAAAVRKINFGYWSYDHDLPYGMVVRTANHSSNAPAVSLIYIFNFDIHHCKTLAEANPKFMGIQIG